MNKPHALMISGMFLGGLPATDALGARGIHDAVPADPWEDALVSGNRRSGVRVIGTSLADQWWLHVL